MAAQCIAMQTKPYFTHMSPDTTKQPTDVIAEFLGEVPHAPGCYRWIHSAAECTCGLADARIAAEDVADLLDRFAAAAQELIDQWERGDIATPANELYAILGEFPARRRDE